MSIHSTYTAAGGALGKLASDQRQAQLLRDQWIALMHKLRDRAYFIRQSQRVLSEADEQLRPGIPRHSKVYVAGCKRNLGNDLKIYAAALDELFRVEAEMDMAGIKYAVDPEDNPFLAAEIILGGLV